MARTRTSPSHTASPDKLQRPLGGKRSPEDNQRIIAFAKLMGQVEAMVQESRNPAGFDAHAWLTRWLTEPLPALGGICPADLIGTMEGQDLASAALSRMQSGTYA